MSKITVNKGVRVVCYGCGQHIHIDDFGGLVKTDGGTAYTHKNLPCLLAFYELTKVIDLQPSDSNTKSRHRKCARCARGGGGVGITKKVKTCIKNLIA